MDQKRPYNDIPNGDTAPVPPVSGDTVPLPSPGEGTEIHSEIFLADIKNMEIRLPCSK